MPGVVRERSAYHCLKSSKPLTTHARPTASGETAKTFSCRSCPRSARRKWAGPRALRTAPAFRSRPPGHAPELRRARPPPLTAACCPRGPSQSLLSVGAAPCRLGVPNACGFLWEEEARVRSARGFGGPGGEDSTTALRYPNSPPSVGP